MKQTLLFSLLALLPVGAWADTYQDPETKVNYEYTVGQSEASVKAGSSSAGSPDATGVIAILAAFTVDGNEYSVTRIGNYAFCNCSGLTSVTIPESVTFIGYRAFYNCSGLTEVRSFIVKPFNINTSVFSNASQATLYVPIGTKAKYEATDGWKEFANIVEMDLDPTDGGEVSYGEGGSIDGETDLSGTVVDNMFYSIGTDAGGYSAEEGCIVITQKRATNRWS